MREPASRARARSSRARCHDEIQRPLRRRRDASSRAAGARVRLRRAARPHDPDLQGAARFQDGVKTREEREVEVSDAGEAEAILERPRARTALSLREAARGVGLRGLRRRARRDAHRQLRRGRGRPGRDPQAHRPARARLRGGDSLLLRRAVRAAAQGGAGSPARHGLGTEGLISPRDGRRDDLMRAILLCAGKGDRFRPVTEAIPKPLLPFLNVPLALAHLRRLHEAGIGEVAVNLHHLGDQVERHLREQPPDLPQLAFFREPAILGTAGALRNAAGFLAAATFSSSTPTRRSSPTSPALIAAPPGLGARRDAPRHGKSGPGSVHAASGRRGPHHGLRLHGPRPLLYTGVCVLAPRLLARIPAGETALVGAPLAAAPRRGAGRARLRPASRARTPISAARAISSARRSKRSSAEDLSRTEAGSFDRAAARPRPRGAVRTSTPPPASSAACGSAPGPGSGDSAVWDGVAVGRGARLTDCVAARGRIPAGAHHEKALLWAAAARRRRRLPAVRARWE